MTPGVYNLPEMTRGDHWAGVPSLTIKVNDSPPSNAIASARIQFRQTKTESGDPLLTIDSAGGRIVLTDTANWIIELPEQALSLPAGIHYYDLETTDSAGVIKTYVAGRIKVNPDISA